MMKKFPEVKKTLRDVAKKFKISYYIRQKAVKYYQTISKTHFSLFTDEFSIIAACLHEALKNTRNVFPQSITQIADAFQDLNYQVNFRSIIRAIICYKGYFKTSQKPIFVPNSKNLKEEKEGAPITEQHVEFEGEKTKVTCHKLKSGYVTKSLNLSGRNINNISSIKGIEKLQDLYLLFLDDNRISEINGLDQSTNLNLLSLENNQISKIKGLKNIKHLYNLNLGSNRITKIENISHMKNLHVLTLNNNEISKIEGFFESSL